MLLTKRKSSPTNHPDQQFRKHWDKVLHQRDPSEPKIPCLSAQEQLSLQETSAVKICLPTTFETNVGAQASIWAEAQKWLEFAGASDPNFRPQAPSPLPSITPQYRAEAQWGIAHLHKFPPKVWTQWSSRTTWRHHCTPLRSQALWRRCCWTAGSPFCRGQKAD